MKFSISDSEKPHLTDTLAWFAGVVVTWAVLHDIHLVQIEPRHFTEYHRTLLPISNPILLAIQYAVIATLGPGLVFGFLAYAACRLGSRQKVPLKPACFGFIAVLVIIELALRCVGRHSQTMVLAGKNPLYPPSLYPEMTSGIVYTQTINISAYLLTPSAGALYLAFLFFSRKERTLPPNQVSDDCVSIQARLIIYFAVWLFTALAFQAFLRPMGLSETDMTPFQQRISWPLYTPVMAVLGLAQAATWPHEMSAWAALAAVAYFIIQAVLVLTPRRSLTLFVLTCVQSILLAVSVIYFVRFSELPTGG